MFSASAMHPSQRMLPLVAAACSALLFPGPGPAAAQQTFHACYVPHVGAVYLTKLSGAPSACLAASHVEITWTEGTPPLGHIEDTRVVFEKTELSVINPGGVLLNLVATDGPVGIRFYKDFGFGNEQQTNPWHMGFIEGVKGYQGLAILRDWLFTSALWDQDGRLIVGRLDPHPPANRPATARFQVRGTVDEVQAMVEAPTGQSAAIFQVVTGAGAQGTRHFAVDGQGDTIIGSPSQPRQLILYDTADGTPYSLKITNGQLSITKVN